MIIAAPNISTVIFTSVMTTNRFGDLTTNEIRYPGREWLIFAVLKIQKTFTVVLDVIFAGPVFKMRFWINESSSGSWIPKTPCLSALTQKHLHTLQFNRWIGQANIHR